ncbi:TPA: winged helix-turn-helix domain-containing protein [Methanosarcina acetivorans]|uniref:Methanogenesis regulatory protein FilR1 middle domain-containing protein n=2 Tax=Methanosarcina acetivorans TaxID=2214 RepID=Q8THF7_METAC|nr:winged helix-turn-helix domain-containing protein [Methanosarcina acetivorans]AAM07899.1 conserved hypothetical protein [Methanosarcina acetivorans C2A]HIH92521.1 winged helix-turn-helix domain-containing protein [Methanosarcina acetivorans]
MKLELLGTLFLSDKRKDLLLLLVERPREIEEIKNILGGTSSAIMAQIKILIGQGLIVHEREMYKLSSLGEVIVNKMDPLLKTLNVYEENRDYWQNHNVNSVPSYLLNQIEDLGHCELVEPELDRMYDLPKRIETELFKSTYLMEVSSYFSPALPSLYIELIRKGINVSLIITDPVFERFRNEYFELLEEYLNKENANLFVCTCNIGLASSIVTDRFLALSFFYKNGIYHNHALMSVEKDSIGWGESLFFYYRKNSRQITTSEL